MCFDSSTCAFKTAGQFNFGFSWPGIWPEGGLKLEILFFVNRSGGLGGIDILRRRLFYTRGKPWPPFYLKPVFIHRVGNSFILLQSAKLKAFIGHIIPKKSIYLKKKKKFLNSELQVVDLVSSLFFEKLCISFFLPVIVCNTSSICY